MLWQSFESIYESINDILQQYEGLVFGKQRPVLSMCLLRFLASSIYVCKEVLLKRLFVVVCLYVSGNVKIQY